MKEFIFIAVLLGNMQITSYRSVPRQTDSTPFITSTGERVHHKGTAVSRDLLKRWGGPIDYGDLIYIENYGFKIVNDTMHQRNKNSIDMWVETYKEEKAVGLKRGRVWLIKTQEKLQEKQRKKK